VFRSANEHDPVFVVAAGHAHPPGDVANSDLEGAVPGLERGWLDDRLGIERRRMLAPYENLAQLAVASVGDAVGRAGWSPGSIDVLICATSFVDDVLPATASMIAKDLCPEAVAFDVNAACASFMYAITIAQGLLLADPGARRIAVCVAERPTAWADYGRRDSSVFWGDAAGCILLQREPTASCFRIASMALLNDNEFPERVRVPRHGTFAHDGRYSYQQVLDLTARGADQVLSGAGTEPAELRAFVGHQSNTRLLHELGDRLGIDWERQWHNVEWAGNQGAAGVATAFSAGWHEHANDLEPGDRVLLAAVGGGYAAGAALLEFAHAAPG
jgi:3-oxoacyl-(acyl-carrier-protein) synthase III